MAITHSDRPSAIRGRIPEGEPQKENPRRRILEGESGSQRRMTIKLASREVWIRLNAVEMLQTLKRWIGWTISIGGRICGSAAPMVTARPGSLLSWSEQERGFLSLLDVSWEPKD